MLQPKRLCGENPRADPASLLAAGYQTEAWESVLRGRRLSSPLPPPPALPPKLALPGLIPEGERALAITWLPLAKQTLCFGPGCWGPVERPQGSPQGFQPAPLC